MGTASITAAIAGQTLTAAFYNTNLNNILNQFNGNVDDVNLKDGAVTTPKIATGAVTGPKIAMGSDAQGDVLYHNGTSYVRLGAGTSGRFLKTQGTGANPVWGSADGGVLGSYRNLKITRPSVTQVTITADELVLEDSSNNKTTVRTVNKTAAITTAGADGLDTGAEAANTWYFIWIIRKSSDGTTASLLSTSSSAPTLPAGYDQKALVSAVRNNAGSDFIDFIHEGEIWSYNNDIVLVSGNAGLAAWVAIAMANFVPAALSTFAFGTFFGFAQRIGVTNKNDETTPDTNGAGGRVVMAGNNETHYWQFPILTANTLYWGSNDAAASVNLLGFVVNKI